MKKYVVRVPSCNEVISKQFLCFTNSKATWYTDWVTDQGYITVVTFDNQEDALEFQMKFT